jgi:hypothetical protein
MGNQYAADILKLARENALAMIQCDETIRKVMTSDNQYFWLANDRQKVVVDQVITVEGREFFIGFFTK